LLLTNGLTALAAIYAVRMAHAFAQPTREIKGMVERKLGTMLARSS
jgi:hypothetical protein